MSALHPPEETAPCPGVSVVEWSVREELALCSAVLQCGNQAWTNVSRLVRLFTEPGRPADWCSPKNCAKQYAKLLDSSESKRSRSDTVNIPWCELIVKRLTVDRIEELHKDIRVEEDGYKKIQSEISMISSGQRDDEVVAMWEDLKNAENLSESDTEEEEEAEIVVKEELISPIAIKDNNKPKRPLRNNKGSDVSESPNISSSGATLRSQGGRPSSPLAVVKKEADDPHVTLEDSGRRSTRAAHRAQEMVSPTPIRPLVLHRSPVLSRLASEELWERVDPPRAGSVSPGGRSDASSNATTAMTVSSESTLVATQEDTGSRTEEDELEEIQETSRRSFKKKSSVTAKDDVNKTPDASEPCIYSARRSLRSAGIPADVTIEDMLQEARSREGSVTDMPTRSKKASKVSAKGSSTSIKPSPLSTPNSSSKRKRDPSVSPEKSPVSKKGTSPVPLLLKLQREHEASTGEVRYKCSLDVSSAVDDDSESSMSMGIPRWSEEDMKMWRKAILLYLHSVTDHRHGHIFMHPVRDDDAVDYSKVVFCPMDLGTLKRRVESGEVNSTNDFLRDLMLIFTNAVMYNASHHLVHKLATEMFTDVMDSVQKCLSVQSVDPYIDPTSHYTVFDHCGLLKRRLSSGSDRSSH